MSGTAVTAPRVMEDCALRAGEPPACAFKSWDELAADAGVRN
jgi:hypothetical protein